MAVSVDIFVSDTEAVPQPIASVVVNAYDGDTLAFVTSATTDVNGQAALLLPGTVLGKTYELRFFKNGVIFTNPQAISVLEPVTPPNTNNFDTSGVLTTLPVATDPRMCRCTGQFINFSGTPVVNALIRVTAILDAGSLTTPPSAPVPPPLIVPPPLPPNLLSGFQVPKVLDGKMVSVDSMEFRTDINGKVSFNLIRKGQYYITFSGEEDVVWHFTVPDRSSANLIDLVHPQPVQLTWDPIDAPGNAVIVNINVMKAVKFTVLFSNFQVYTADLSNVFTFTNSDGTLADVVYNSGLGQIEITGRVAGTVNVTAAVNPNMTPARVPDYSLTITPLAVTIVP